MLGRHRLRTAGSVLLLAASLTFALALLPAVQAHDQTVRLQDPWDYDVRTFNVEPGEEVTLTLINEGVQDHTFTLLAQANPADLISALEAQDNDAILQYNETYSKLQDAQGNPIDVRLAQGEQTTVTFTAPMTEGDYYYVCTIPQHAANGMWGRMVVGEPEAPGGGLDPVVLGVVVGVVAVVVVGAAFFLLRRRQG